MNGSAPSANEQQAAAAFSRQAPVFDQVYQPDLTIQYKRQRVWKHAEKYLLPGSHILELNAGTGEDATHFAQNGHFVHATDIAAAMLGQLTEKVKNKNLDDQISHEICSYTGLGNLKNKGPYDFIFSNFAGLNCTQQLDQVIHSLPPLLKPGGFVTLVLLPQFCLWEFLLLFKGKFRTAFRRFSGKKGTPARVEGQSFRCWYYNPSFVQQHAKENFNIVDLEGLCSIVPPSYIEGFGNKHTRLFSFLKKTENKWKKRWPWRSVGDYYIITLQKKKDQGKEKAASFSS